ncbi:unnamed protein product [Gongylonema pulchrum]|uniref:Transposase n=1 Tax=Gongylonema pulchrum TaxID=637853 RepID=A0A183DCW0_9BILA|nr:unnamed protein product [Gongylonema pulchrum]
MHDLAAILTVLTFPNNVYDKRIQADNSNPKLISLKTHSGNVMGNRNNTMNVANVTAAIMVTFAFPNTSQRSASAHSEEH